ncbi:sugar ABC transporter substrate-binding protein [Nocardioides sp. SOB77]|uniref:Sugar ABC transporter substrate-binding protein n=1 Tax=Nocardioides oceani TaxID=3058369 RepID=A0ABT8FHY2_9ACTN|nr:substrate-binding domain-containing protein [Nocardioides oceani]MDN4174065.1 sugar ABC transporter substrate-binding protein [Nocardioides oceani]
MSPHRHTARRGAALLASAALVSMLGACAQDSVKAETGGSAEDSASGIAQAKEAVEALRAAVTEYPEEPALSSTPDLAGKKVTVIPLGDNIPVIHGVAVGIQDAMEAVGATATICDGKFTPTAVADCLKQAGDQGADAVVSLFIDYAMAGTAFDALADRGVPVLIGGVEPTGGRESDETLAFYDNTGRVGKLYDAMSMSALAQGGEDTNVLWLRLMDSTTTREASEQGVATFEELCPTCGIATADFTTANLDKLPSAVSAAMVANPDTNTLIVPVDSFVPPAMQGLQSSGKADQVRVFSSSSDLAGLQRVRDGQQASDLGTPVIYEGWKYANGLMQLLAGDEVRPADAMVTRDFVADNVGDLELTDDAYFTPDWFGDDRFKDAFLEAWGVEQR